MRCRNRFRVIMTAVAWVSVFAHSQAAETAEERGKYLMYMAGCVSCHTREGGELLAGGLAMETPFGTFYTPNITPHETSGIGGWSTEQFISAMTEGVAPDGRHYYPAFPYTSYSAMSEQDLRDLKAYLNTLPAVDNRVLEHDLSFPYSMRSLLGLWKRLHFEPPKPDAGEAKRSALWERGRYIVQGPGHCGECHTPRNFMGGLERENHLAGNPEGPEGEAVPSLAPDDPQFSKWTVEDIVFALQTGMRPDGDFLGGTMGHVIDNSTGKLTDEDLRAIAEYLKNPKRS